MGVKFLDLDRGYEEMRKRADAIKKRRVTVGIHAKDDGRNTGDLTNADVGTFHEYGTAHLPERSFLRRTLDEHGPEYVEMCKKLSQDVLEGKMDIDRALGLLGARIKADVIRLFDQNQIRPDISEARKEQKGSSTVLIDTAALKQSIDFLVRGLFNDG